MKIHLYKIQNTRLQTYFLLEYWLSPMLLSGCKVQEFDLRVNIGLPNLSRLPLLYWAVVDIGTTLSLQCSACDCLFEFASQLSVIVWIFVANWLLYLNISLRKRKGYNRRLIARQQNLKRFPALDNSHTRYKAKHIFLESLHWLSPMLLSGCTVQEFDLRVNIGLPNLSRLTLLHWAAVDIGTTSSLQCSTCLSFWICQRLFEGFWDT